MSAGPSLIDRCVVGVDVESYGRRNARPGAIVVNGDFVVGGNVDTSITTTTHLGTGTHGDASH